MEPVMTRVTKWTSPLNSSIGYYTFIIIVVVVVIIVILIFFF